MEAQAQGKMMASSWKISGGVTEAGQPQILFDTDFQPVPHPSPRHVYAVTADGQRFLIPVPPASVGEPSDSTAIMVVQDWRTLLGK